MKVQLRTWTDDVGEVRLESGRAVGSNAHTRRLIASTKIIEPGTLELLRSGDGERYLRALPANLNGYYLTAVIVEDPAGQPTPPSRDGSRVVTAAQKITPTSAGSCPFRLAFVGGVLQIPKTPSSRAAWALRSARSQCP